MRKTLLKFGIPFALLGIALVGCSSSDSPSDNVESAKEIEEVATLPDPEQHLKDCWMESDEYTVLDGGNAVEFDAPWIDMPPFDCVAERIGLPEATLKTAKPGDKMQADGYTITIMKSGASQTAILERQ